MQYLKSNINDDLLLNNGKILIIKNQTSDCNLAFDIFCGLGFKNITQIQSNIDNLYSKFDEINPDIIILDFSKISEASLLCDVIDNPKYSNLPFIILIEENEVQFCNKSKVFESGLSDYIAKTYRASRTKS